MNILEIFRRTRNPSQDQLVQILKNQQEILTRLEQLTQKVDSLRAPVSRTSISAPLRTIISPLDITQAPRIMDFLQRKNITIKTLPAAQAHDEVLNEIAWQIGSKFETVAPFMDRIKRSLQSPQHIHMSLINDTQQAVADITALGYALHKLAFLQEFNYKKSPHFTIVARASSESRAINFFTGNWLERYMTCMIQLLAKETAISDFEIIANPQIVLGNGNNFELDILFHANQRIYWTECKTGNYQNHVQKYSQFAQFLDLPESQMLLILADAEAHTTTNLSQLFHMRAMNITQARTFLDAELRR